MAESQCDKYKLMLQRLHVKPTDVEGVKELEDYAARVMPGKYKQLAMGGQQTKAAIALLHEAAKNGAWLCLKNLHLVVHWVPTLEKELSSLTPNEGFRLWLTTEQHANFPTIILQQSLKITFEAPPGLQKNLQRTYASWNAKFIGDGPPVRAGVLRRAKGRRRLAAGRDARSASRDGVQGLEDGG